MSNMHLPTVEDSRYLQLMRDKAALEEELRQMRTQRVARDWKGPPQPIRRPPPPARARNRRRRHTLEFFRPAGMSEGAVEQLGRMSALRRLTVSFAELGSLGWFWGTLAKARRAAGLSSHRAMIADLEGQQGPRPSSSWAWRNGLFIVAIGAALGAWFVLASTPPAAASEVTLQGELDPPLVPLPRGGGINRGPTP